MSYPPVRYTGETGEVSATLRPATAQPEVTYPNGGKVDYLATTLSTSGEFGLYRWTFGSGVSGPDAHFHRTISESFFILEGVVRLYDGDRWVDARSGDFLYVPPGGIHAFKHEDEDPASMLLLFAPGAPREDYFETLATLGRGATMTEEERTAFFERHDNIWL
jgi:mannose-6-phosphate isomerase-like protein (cupin superfamily)